MADEPTRPRESEAEARKRSERRQAFLLRLSDALRPLADSVEMERAAMRVLAEELVVDRAFLATIGDDDASWSIRQDYADGLPSKAGCHPMSEFQRKRLPLWRAGIMSSVSDSETDATFSASDRAAYAAFGSRAAIGVPLVKGGRFAALLSVNQVGPRDWTEAELELTREAAERTWAAIERVRAEEALRQGEERLRLALSAARMVAWEWTPADGKLRVSETAAEVFGLPAGVGLTGIDQGLALVHPDDVAMYEATFRDAIERRGGYHIDYRLVRPSDGRVIWIEERGDTVFDQPGGGVRLFGVAADVTERKLAEEEAARLAGRLSLALDAGGLGTWEWDPATDEMTVSDRAAEMYGTPQGVPHGREEGRLMIHPDDRERARETAARAVAEGTDYDIEYRLADRPVWVAAHGRGLYDAAGNLVRVHGVVQDVTERKRAEEELREADRKKDEFIALLAHELRNPLAPIRNGLEVLKMSGVGGASAWAMGIMDRQLTHMVRLIDDLLDVSRINRHKMELRRGRVALAEVIASAVETAQPTIDAAGHELTLTLPGKPIDLDADLTRLAQVFSNLLTNSAKYTPQGGKIWVSAALDGDAVSVSVRDTGIGIPEADLPNIFDMFSQVDRSIERSTGGLGIGLALVKGLTEMHGGTVGVASAGGGATFTVTLPVLDRPAESQASAVSTAAKSMGRRILVVDDNRDGAVSLSRLLEMRGHKVRTAFDGFEAVESAREHRPEVVLMDVGMPGLNGYQATRRIRSQDWGVGMTIIALTGWGQDGDRKLSREAGCDGHLVKPVSLPDIERVLSELDAKR